MHAWDCPCGTRNAPQFTVCRRCEKPRAQGATIAPPTAPNPLGPPIQWRMPHWSFILGCLAVVAFFVISGMSRDTGQQQARAKQIFTEKFSAAVGSVPGGSTSMRLLNFRTGPHILMEGDWYGIPRRQKEIILEKLGGVWSKSEGEAGLGSASGLVVIEDTSGNEVGTWGAAGGAKVLRE